MHLDLLSEFEDSLVTFEEFAKMKEAGTLPLKQVRVLVWE